MTMIEQSMICPYAGLRSFTEDESLYFKGRDVQVDQITALLEVNKFLMVTGASGEGKSSLIYAGLIPNAKAGFFKASYTNWVVADFRPERSPVHNMAAALASKFASNPATVETEIRRGFSSLVDLYTNSEFYINENEENWNQLSDLQKRDRKRQAANLLILVDQFEEFFTNPENFHNEVPSEDSQIVINLILETARIAVKKNLPVYIICTMRSDYIGQCSSFRGLPEYIGFSQFFVPRLKRKDLKQVIEEPAVLSGNRISQRLIERLVFDVSEGVDQLPILQHALNQVWLMADQGKEQMDLVHYAMLGGMPAHELPDEDQARIQKWFESLPELQRKHYRETGLSKVIEIHASMLYENAWERYNQQYPESPLSVHDIKRIIVNTFCCLTKIDNSRAVRNRMSLEEIAEIINTPGTTAVTVGNVINVFREEGNSFIRPFKTDNPSTHNLPPDIVLDITHESLIRNWNKLNRWANKEFEYYSTYLDFRKQLDRWKESRKSSAYLLPIGPLTYFEKWYGECKPNAGWIKRYAEIQVNKRKATADANTVLSDVREFLRRSARNVAVTRAFMKYGPQRIATILAIIIMLTLSGFYWYDAEQKKNLKIIEEVRAKAFGLLNSKEIDLGTKAFHLIMEERYEQGALISQLTRLDEESRIGVAIRAYRELLVIDKHSTRPVKREVIDFIKKYFDAENVPKDDQLYLTQLNDFCILLSYDNYYNPDKDVRQLLKETTEIGYNLTKRFFKEKKSARPSFPIEINVSIQWWLTFGEVTEPKVNDLLEFLSPLLADSTKNVFDLYYAKGNEEPNGRVGNINSGGFHTLASLYASIGDVNGVLWCFSEIKKGGQNDYFGIGRQLNNYNNIVGYFYQFGHQKDITPVLDWLSKNDLLDQPLTVYRNVVIRSGYLSRYFPNTINEFYLRSYRGNVFPNLCFSEEPIFNAVADDYKKEILKIENVNERNYVMAMYYKRLAMHRHKYYFDRSLPYEKADFEGWLNKAVEHFRLVDESYLSEKPQPAPTIPYVTDGVRPRESTREHLFIYPDYMDGWFSSTFHSDLFFNYLSAHDLLAEFYQTPEELELLNFWLAKAHEFKPAVFMSADYDNFFPLSNESLLKLHSFIANHPAGKDIDLNCLQIILANRFFNARDSVKGLEYAGKFNRERILRTAERYEYIEKTFFLNQVKELGKNYAVIGNRKLALDVAERFQGLHEKFFCYVYMAESLYETKDPQTFIYLDSALSKMEYIDFATVPFPSDARYNLIALLSKIGGERLNKLAFEVLRDVPEGPKVFGTLRMANSMAIEGNFYNALMVIPPTFTEVEDLISCELILWVACINREKEFGNKDWVAMDNSMTSAWNYPIYFRPF